MLDAGCYIIEFLTYKLHKCIAPHGLHSVCNQIQCLSAYYIRAHIDTRVLPDITNIVASNTYLRTVYRIAFSAEFPEFMQICGIRPSGGFLATNLRMAA